MLPVLMAVTCSCWLACGSVLWLVLNHCFNLKQKILDDRVREEINNMMYII